jgi:hypothetical protein
MTTDERTATNLDTFIAPAPEAGALTLRPFSAGTLTLCRALGLTMPEASPRHSLMVTRCAPCIHNSVSHRQTAPAKPPASQHAAWT